MVEQVVRELGGVEILVNNAGVQSRIPFLKLPYVPGTSRCRDDQPS